MVFSLLWSLFPAHAQVDDATVEVERFQLTCPSSAVEGDTLQCTVSDTGVGVGAWPVVAILHLSSDADRALVLGVPVDVALQAPDAGTAIDGGVWWVGDVLVGYARTDLAGESEGEGDTRTVSVAVSDDEDYETAERFYVALAEDGVRAVGALYLNRRAIQIGASDTRSTDASLTDLDVSTSDGRLALAFVGTTTSYVASVAYDVAEAVVTPTASHGRATIAVQGGPVESGAGSAGVALGVGATRVETVVTAEDGSSRTYVIDVTRAARGDNVEVEADGFTLTCPALVDEGTDVSCTLANGSGGAADWPVVAILHSSADADRALISEDPLIPASSSSFATDVGLAADQTPARSDYNFGYGELLSGESRSIYATYGYEKFDWGGAAADEEQRSVVIGVAADDVVEEEETFYVALAPSGYTGLSDLVDNKVPLVVQDASGEVPGAPAAVAVATGDGELTVSWVAPTADGGKPVTGYVVQWKADGEDYDATREALAASSPHTVEGLQNGTEYTVRVVAVNAVGRSESSAEASGTPSGPKASSDATLSGLSLSGIDIGTFAGGTTAYAASVGHDVTSATVTAAANDAGGSVTIADADGSTTDAARTVALAVGENAITVTVTAADGETTMTYAVSVTRAASSDATLSGLSLSGIDIGTFAGGTTAYAASVGHDVTSATVTAAANDAGASVTIADADGSTTDAARTVALAVGENAITVTVTAADGETTMTYAVSVTRAASSDATLSALSLSGIDIGTFAGGTTAYAASVGHDVTSATVTAAANDAGGSVTIADADGSTTDAARTVALAVGENAITVTVTAADGETTMTYAVSVTRAASSDATLSALSLSGIDIGTFAGGTTAYAASVGHDVTSTTMTATANDAGASVTIADADGSTTDAARTVTLAVGENAITVTVTAADDETTATYTVSVTRAAVAGGEPPNVVLILADDLGFSDIGAYGSQIETPNIDALARDGLRFSQFYNMAKCEMTRASLFTGLFVEKRHADNAQALPTLLGGAGYHTIMVGKEHFRGWAARRLLGRSLFDEALTFSVLVPYLVPDDGAWERPFMLNGREMQPGELDVDRQPFHKTDAMTDYALRFLEQAQANDQPFFLYLPYHAPHYPLQAREEDIARYRDEYRVGWDAVRAERFRRLQAGGLLPAGVRLSPPEGNVNRFRQPYPAATGAYRPWAGLEAAEQEALALEMAVYARDGRPTGPEHRPRPRQARRPWRSRRHARPVPVRQRFVPVRQQRGRLGTAGRRGFVQDPERGVGKRRQHAVPVLQAVRPRGRHARAVHRALAGPSRPRYNRSAGPRGRPSADLAGVGGHELPPQRRWCCDADARRGQPRAGPRRGHALAARTAARRVHRALPDGAHGGLEDRAHERRALAALQFGDGPDGVTGPRDERTGAARVPGRALRRVDRSARRRAAAFRRGCRSRRGRNSRRPKTLAALASLELEGVDIGTFDADTVVYAATVDPDTERTTVDAVAEAAGATVAIVPADANADAADGHQVALAAGATTGIVVGVGVGSKARAYVVDVMRPAPTDATLRGLSLTGIGIGAFDGATTAYTAAVGHEVTTTTVTATATDASASVTIADAHGSTTDGPRTVSLAVGGNTITVTVKAAEGATTKAYTVAVTRAASNDATLRALTLSGLDIGTFDAATTAYAAAAAEVAAATTVTATPNDAGATVVITDGDGSMSGTARDVALGYGANAITMTVTAADGQTTKTYTVTVTRAYTPPTATITAETSAVTEGASASFAVRLDKAAKDALTVAVTVAETGGMLTATESSVAIAAGDTAATLELGTVDDNVVEEASTVTATLAAGDGYTVGTTDSAEVSVADDDAATFAVAASPGTINEGGASTVTVSITNGVVFAADQTVTLAGSGTAAADDYTLSRTSLTLAAGDATVSATVTATDDEAEELAETVTLTAGHGGTEVGAATVTIVANDGPDDATLAMLALSGVAFDFRSEIEEYAVNAGQLESTTITATPSDADASVVVDPVDEDADAGNGHQVRLSVGENLIAATVTSEDEQTTKTYTVRVTRTELDAAVSLRRADRDFDGLAANVPFGLWSDGTTLWIATWWGGGVLAFDLGGGGRTGDRDIETASDNGSPVGLWSDGETLWAAEHGGGIYAYRLSDGERVSAEDLGPTMTAAGNEAPTGLWSDGSTLWVADRSDAHVYAFRLSDKTRDEEREFGLDEGTRAYGLWSDGTTMWVTDFTGGRVAAYALTDGSRDEGRDYDTSQVGNGSPTGLWSDGATLWVGDRYDDQKLYAYALFGATEAAASADATLGRLSLSGVDIGEFDSATTGYAAEVANGVSSTTVTASPTNPAASVTIADSDGSAAGTTRLVSLAVGRTDIAVTVTAADGETTATYTVAVRRAASSDATLSTLSLSGIDIGPFEAATLNYAASVGHQVSSTTVNAVAGDATASVAIGDADGSSKGTSRTVSLSVGRNEVSVSVTAGDGQTTAEYMVAVTRAASPPSDDATLSGLSLTGVDIGGFDGATSAYAASVGHDVTSTTVTAAANDAGASVTIADADGSTTDAARTVALAVGENAITVTVTAADGETTMTYAVSVTRAASSDATLSALSLSGIDIGTFAGGMTAYAASVGHSDVTSTTVTATANDAGASVTIADADGSTTDAARTVALAVGENAITVTVTAADGETTMTYAVLVTRAASSDATLSALSLSGIDIGTFAGGTTAYAASVGHDVTSATVTAAANDAGASVTIADADGSTTDAARTVALAVGENAITVTVTAADGETTMTYAVSVTRAASSDATLSALSLSGIDIGTFAGGTTAYAASVGQDVTSTTVTATANDAGASVTIADADGSTTDAARTVALAVGENAITVTVTAADGETTATYTVAVTRAGGPLVAAFEDVPAEHYGSLEFELGLRFSEEFPLSYRTLKGALKVDAGVLGSVRRTTPGSNLGWRIKVRPRTVRDVTVTLPGGLACDAEDAICTADGRALSNSPTATLPGPDFRISADAAAVPEGTPASFTVRRAGAAELRMEVALRVKESGRVLREAPPGSVVFGIGENSVAVSLATDDDAVSEGDSTVTATLDMRPARESAAVTVLDDDEATFALAAQPAEIEEGASSTVSVSVADGVTFAKRQTLSLSATGTADAGDYALEPTTLVLAAGAGSAAATLTATDDGAKEDDETVIVSAALGGETVGETTVTIAANDAEASDDATLAALSLSGVDIGAFDKATTEYAASVEHDVGSTTVTATPSDASAEVRISDASGATVGTTRTTRLAEGANAIGVRVSAEDRIATADYGVMVTREAAPEVAWGVRQPTRDIDLSAADRPRGLWSDGETLWTGDWDNGTVLAYALEDGSRLAEKDFTLGLFLASALWSDGETLWAANFEGGVHAYGLADGERLTEEDLDADAMAAAGNDAPAGLWSDGDTMWVADHSDAWVYAYGLSDGSRREAREFTLRTADDDAVRVIRPLGLYSDGETVLATDWNRGTVRGYALDGARRAERDIDESATANGHAAGLWSDGRTLWVVDETEQKAFAYAATELRDPEPIRQSLIGDLRSRASAVPGGAAAGAAVAIPDPGLRARVLVALGKGPDDSVGARELAVLEVLDARDAGVESLVGLEHAVNLEGIDLGHNAVADLRPLASLAGLRRLNLDGAAPDLWGVSGLTTLTGLSVRGNGIEDLGALAGLARLERLEVADNRIAELAPIAGLVHLKALRLDGNRVDDLSALAGLGNLRYLSVRGNAVTDVRPLARLAQLRTLILRDNRVEDLSPLAGGVDALRLLDVRGNGIADFSALGGRGGLRVIGERASRDAR